MRILKYIPKLYRFLMQPLNSWTKLCFFLPTCQHDGVPKTECFRSQSTKFMAKIVRMWNTEYSAGNTHIQYPCLFCTFQFLERLLSLNRMIVVGWTMFSVNDDAVCNSNHVFCLNAESTMNDVMCVCAACVCERESSTSSPPQRFFPSAFNAQLEPFFFNSIRIVVRYINAKHSIWTY